MIADAPGIKDAAPEPLPRGGITTSLRASTPHAMTACRNSRIGQDEIGQLGAVAEGRRTVLCAQLAV